MKSLTINRILGFTHKQVNNDVHILQKGFITPEKDVKMYYRILNEISNIFGIIPMVGINHFLILIDKNSLEAKIYVNELTIMLKTIAARAVKKGEKINRSDIKGVVSLEFENLTIPDDCGIIFFFSHHWHNGLYFDLTPLNSDKVLGKINNILANIYEYFIYSEYFLANEDDLNYLMDNGWFPFISIMGDFYDNLIKAIESNISIQKSEKQIYEHFKKDEVITSLLNRYKQLNLMDDHLNFIESGLNHFKNNDFIASCSIIWPRIEGILRNVYVGIGRRTQNNLSDNILEILDDVPKTFFSDSFNKFLKCHYFKDFDPNSSRNDASRNSITHGIISEEEMNEKNALIGILIVDQLSYYIKNSLLISI